MTWSLDMDAAPRSTVDDRGLVRAHYLLGFVPELANPNSDPKLAVTVIWWESLLHDGCWMSDAADVVAPTMWAEIEPLPAIGAAA